MNRQFYPIFACYCVIQTRSHAKYYLFKDWETTSVCSIAFNQKSDVVVFFIWGGEEDFLGGGSFKGET